MPKYNDDIQTILPNLAPLLRTASEQLPANDDQSKAQVTALTRLFRDEPQALSLLITCSNEAPTAFAHQWEITSTAVAEYTKDPQRAMRLLARLLGWAYIESMWRRSRASGSSFSEVTGQDFATLAAIQLGLALNSTEDSVRAAILTDGRLVSGLLLENFEVNVKDGLQKALATLGAIDTRIAGWERNLDEIEGKTKIAEQKIAGYQKTIEQYRVQFGFLGLTAAYKAFFQRKQIERNILLAVLCVVAALTLSVPFARHLIFSLWSKAGVVPIAPTVDITKSNEPKGAKPSADPRASATPVTKAAEPIAPTATPPANEPKGAKQSGDLKAGTATVPKAAAPIAPTATPPSTPTAAATKDDAHARFIDWGLLLNYGSLAVLILLLIYFFRVVLIHFNSAQAQLLQLEIRIAACGFIEEYVKFRKDSGDPDLTKFEALVFGGIVADMDKVPSTFDGLNQLVDTIKQIRGETK